ncbi:hypothetical protein GCM10022419_108920 [Nonomuraea rosea]|uniref:Anti-sigma factor antagonist n=1 Tax=Nonomuraea rosea TaxID=638574 RepID=A0ABP6ZFS0_9ACTN
MPDDCQHPDGKIEDPPQLEVHVQRLPHARPTLLVILSGPLDHTSAAQLTRTLLRLTAVPSPPHLIMDAARLTFCDSSGLSTLVTVCQSLRAGGGQLALADAPASLTQLLTRTGLTAAFELYPSVAAAEAALAE